MLTKFGDAFSRVENAVKSFRNGEGALLVDDENRENEGDLVFPAQTITERQMAMLIRECSGIVCLPMSGDLADGLELPMMTEVNTSKNKTAFTVSIEAKSGVTTGVSAKDRVTTIRTAVADGAKPEDLARPGHVFPLRAADGGVFERRGHTEGTVELAKLAGFKAAGVLCELTNPDGTMARLPQIIDFAVAHGYPVVTIEDICMYLKR
jgi:3,4-dihydroxy 2-butanone 4-phosphate synthase